MFERLSDEIRKENLVISPSALMEFAISPAHYHAAYILKEKEQTDAMFEGELVHKIILEPEKFEDKFAVLEPKENYLTTVDQIKEAITDLGEKPVRGNKSDLISQHIALDPNAKIWELYLERMNEQNKRLVDHKTYGKLMRIVHNVKKHPWLSKTIPGGMIEQPAWFKHELGIYFSLRMDYFNKGLGIGKVPLVLDVKKVRNANPMEFQKTIFNNKLFIQAAIYVDAIKAITGIEPHFAWALVEFDSPYNVEVAAADNGCIEAGRQAYNKLLRKFIECHETNSWPSYTNGICTNVSLPPWAFEKLDYDADMEIEGF